MTGRTSHDAVLSAARDLFTTKGFANTSVREICESAGVTPPALYYHFGSKDALFQAVVEEALRLDTFNGLLGEAVAAGPDVWAKLDAYVRTYLTCFPIHLLNPGLHLHDTAQLSGASLRQLQTGLSDTYQLAKDLLQEGIAAGAFRELDVDVAASCLMGLVDSFVRARVYLGVEYDVERVIDGILELVKHGLTASPVSASR